MKIIILATKNAGKIAEFRKALEPLGFNCVSLLDLHYDEEIKETGKTFLANAKIKAKTIGKKYQELCLGDDSGLIVDALPNLLGVNSKRFSESETYADNNKLLLEILKGEKNRNAHFETALVLYNPQKGFYEFFGRVDGIIMEDLKGENGFGYDPLFFIPSLGRRLAELSKEEKNAISHRGKAIQAFIKAIEDNHEIIDL